MLSLKNDVEKTEEFSKADITVRSITVISGKKATKEAFKISIPGRQTINPVVIVIQDWDSSSLQEYLSTQQFLFMIFEKIEKNMIFKGAKFWRVNYKDLHTSIKQTWEETKFILNHGVNLKYHKRKTPTQTGKLYYVSNNLPEASSAEAMHVGPSTRYACYYKNTNYAMRLPFASNWIDRPKHTVSEDGKKTVNPPEHELSDDYMTKQSWWFNPR